MPITAVLTNLATAQGADITGLITHSPGSWNDPSKHKQFTGALNCMQIARNQNVLHHEMCDKCLTIMGLSDTRDVTVMQDISSC
jgi:hypothetical protein